MRKSFKYCLTFILTTIICIVLLIVTALIPKELVKSNMVKSSEEMYDIGYDEYINSDGVCIIEWANLIEDILPDEYLDIELSYKDMGREMILKPVGEKYKKIVEELTK